MVPTWYRPSRREGMLHKDPSAGDNSYSKFTINFMLYISKLIVNSSRSAPSGHHQMLFFCAQSKTEIFLKKCLINKWGGKFANRVG